MKAIGFQMAVEVARHFNTALRWTFKMEIDLVAVKRLLAYASLQPEDRKETSYKFKGKIHFENAQMRYQPHLEPAIRNLTF